MIDKDDPRLPWVQLADALREKIQTGELTGRVPSERTLAQENEIAPMTVRKALHQLREEGLIISVPGRGTFVKR